VSLFRSLSTRSFTLLWAGQTVSRLGDSLYRIALAWWVLEKTGSPVAMGSVMIVSVLPLVITVLVGGTLADRLPRARVMLASDLLRGVLVGLMAALALTDSLTMWMVYVAAATFGMVDAFFQPAFAAVVPEITPRESLTSANSLTSLSQQLAEVAGPAVGAAIVAWGGTGWAFALDGFSFLVSAGFLVGLPALRPERGENLQAPIWTDLNEGLRTVFGTPWLWISIALFSLLNITAATPVNVGLPFLVNDTLHLDVSSLGLLYSLAAVGSLLGSVWLGRKSQIRRRGLFGYGLIVLAGVATLSLGLPLGLAVLGGLMVVRGLAFSGFGLIWTNLVQELVPGELLGRVTSVDYLGSFGLLPIGYALSGWAIDAFGVQAVLVAGGGLTALVTLVGMLHPAIRRLD
jgi:DHA3 family tetracycline resistance protein-like MFS transporter